MTGIKLTRAQAQMLDDHEGLGPKQALAYTGDLGSRRTWDKLYAMGLLKGGRLTAAGQAALNASRGQHDLVTTIFV